MTPQPAEPRPPAVRASDADREAVVARLQTAMAEGRITVDEFTDRVDGAHRARTHGELDQLVTDLPTGGTPLPALLPGRVGAEAVTSVFGDIRLAGSGAPASARTVFGDVRLDLRALRTDADVVEIRLWSFFGDLDVVVAEGVEAELTGSTVFGSRRTELAPVPRVPGTPRVVVRGRSVFGDLRLRSLAPGEPVSRWRAALDRLAPRPPRPPELPGR